MPADSIAAATKNGNLGNVPLAVQAHGAPRWKMTARWVLRTIVYPKHRQMMPASEPAIPKVGPFPSGRVLLVTGCADQELPMRVRVQISQYTDRTVREETS
jgi:hypothetical protein